MTCAVDGVQVDAVQRFDGEFITGREHKVVEWANGVEELLEMAFDVLAREIADMAGDLCVESCLLERVGALLDPGCVGRCNVHICTLGQALFGNSIANSGTAANDKDG